MVMKWGWFMALASADSEQEVKRQTWFRLGEQTWNPK